MTRVVVLGSSNACEGTWPEVLCDRLGWEPLVFSVGGGGFTQSGRSRFSAQLQNAIDNTPYPETVEYVIIGDASNDIRALASVRAEAADMFAKAEAAFPSARVIVIPALWGITPDNVIPSRMLSVTSRYQELRDAAAGTRVEIIPGSWLWHWDTPAWMRPKTSTESGVHYTPAGYQRVADFVGRYLAGLPVDAPLGWQYISGVDAYYVDEGTAWVRARRDGNQSTLHGRLTVKRDAPKDTHLGWIPRGMAPLETVHVPVVSDTRLAGYIDIFPTGQVRSFTALPADTWNVLAHLPVF